MNKISIKKISFQSLIKLSALIYSSFGTIIGSIALLGSLLKLPVKTTLGFTTFQGISVRIASFFLAPIIFELLGIGLGIISYYQANIRVI